ncbi:hypothetical protein NW754_001348 [Fusarium falciforme]|nr:hypothetical protein NW754_001348 [Fusarium falciforme]
MRGTLKVPLLQPHKPGPDTKIFNKFNGRIYSTTFKGTVFNVIAWHGSFFPFKYDLGKFNTVGSLTYDHTDPSTLVVLTVAGGSPESPLLTLPAIETLRLGSMAGSLAATRVRHRARPRSTTECVHMESAEKAWDKAIHAELAPVKPDPNSMAIMLESSHNLGISKWGQSNKTLIGDPI